MVLLVAVAAPVALYLLLEVEAVGVQERHCCYYRQLPLLQRQYLSLSPSFHLFLPDSGQ